MTRGYNKGVKGEHQQMKTMQEIMDEILAIEDPHEALIQLMVGHKELSLDVSEQIVLIDAGRQNVLAEAMQTYRSRWTVDALAYYEQCLQ